MKKHLLYLCSAVLAMLSTSCFEHTTTIRLEKDGSGTITEETTFGEQVMAMLAQIPAESGQNPLTKMADKAAAEKTATTMGEGVTVDKAEAIGDPAKGARVVYKFKDINKLKYNFGKSIANAGDEEQNKDEEPMSFTYADGKLTMKLPNPKPNPDKPEAGTVSDEQIQQASAMFKDTHVAFKLVVPSGISKSSATYVDGDTVTLLDMSFAKLIEQPDKFRQVMEKQPENPKEMAEMVKGVDGIKLETKEEVTIDVK